MKGHELAFDQDDEGTTARCSCGVFEESHFEADGAHLAGAVHLARSCFDRARELEAERNDVVDELLATLGHTGVHHPGGERLECRR